MRSICFLVLLCSAAFLFAQPYGIGHVSVNFKDPARTGGFSIGGAATFPAGATGRTLGTEIYYPATATGNNTTFAPGKFPVIVFGHGFAMTWDAYTTFFDSMARNGYIVAMLRTESDLLPAPSHLDFGKDLAMVAKLMLSMDTSLASNFYGKMTGREAIGGHSMGGGATFLADSFTNANVVCYFTFAAAETNPSAVAAARRITKPHLVFSGTYDCVAPPANHQTLIYNALVSSCKTQINITKGYHCAFADNNFNCGFGEGTCITAGGLTSAVQQRLVRMYLNPYLDYHLKTLCPAWTKFANLIDTATIATVTDSCNTTVPGFATISGDSSFCKGNVSALTAGPAGFNYLWSNSNTGLVNHVLLGGVYTLTVSNGTCSITSTPFNLIRDSVPVLPVFTTSTDTVCFNTTNIQVAVANNPYATGYNWTIPLGWTITQGDSTNAITVTADTSSGVISVSAENSCGVSVAAVANMVADGGPVMKGPITGNDTICANSGTQNYGISNLPGNVSDFIWSVPAEWNFIGSPSSPLITVKPGQSGVITVSAVNGCGTSDTLTLNILVSDTPTPVITESEHVLVATAGNYYQWYLNGQFLIAASGQAFTPFASGDYTVEVGNAAGCRGFSAVYNYTIISGIEEEQSSAVKIYPNPAKDFVQVILPPYTNGRIELYDLQGRLVLQQVIELLGNTIRLGDINSGTYLLNVYSQGGVMRKMLVVE